MHSGQYFQGPYQLRCLEPHFHWPIGRCFQKNICHLCYISWGLGCPSGAQCKRCSSKLEVLFWSFDKMKFFSWFVKMSKINHIEQTISFHMFLKKVVLRGEICMIHTQVCSTPFFKMVWKSPLILWKIPWTAIQMLAKVLWVTPRDFQHWEFKNFAYLV